MVAISNPNGSDIAERRSQPPTPVNMAAVEAAAQMPLQAAVAAHPPLPVDPSAQTALAAPQHLACTGGAQWLC